MGKATSSSDPFEKPLARPIAAELPAARGSWIGVLGRAATIALLVTTIHACAIRGAFVWDDVAAISENRLIHSPTGWQAFWLDNEQPDYWPVSYCALWLEWRLFERNPAGYRIINLVLHTVNALLVWRLLWQLRVRGAWLCGLLFAIHPVTVEAIEWIIQIKTLLATTFTLLTLILFLQFDATNRAVWFVGAILAYGTALLAKSAVVTVPGILLLLLFWRRGRISRTDLWRLLPFLVLSVGLGAVGAWYQHNNSIGSAIVREDGPISRSIIAGRAVGFYAGKALLPVRLSFIYPRWALPAGIAEGGAMALAVVVGAVLIWRAGWGRACLVALGCYVLALLPALGFVNIYFMRYSLVADHYQYLALPALLALVVAGASGLLTRFAPGSKAAPILGSALAVLALGLLAQQRALVFAGANNERIWQDIAAKNASDWLSRHNLAIALGARGRPAEAQAQLSAAIDLATRYADWDAAAYSRLADTAVNFGNTQLAVDLARRAVQRNPNSAEIRLSLAGTLAANRELPAARAEAQRAIELRPNDWAIYNKVGTLLTDAGSFDDAELAYAGALRINPNCADAHYNLGNLLVRRGDLPRGAEHSRAACQVDPYFAEAYLVLASVLAQQGQVAEATAQARRAIELRPDDWRIYNNVGTLLTNAGSLNDAELAYAGALRINPNCADAHYNLGNLLLQRGDLPRGAEHLRAACQADPAFGDAYLVLASVLAQQGHETEAITSYRRAIDLGIVNPILHNNLGVLLLGQKQPAEAAAQFRRALELDPNYAEARRNLDSITP